MINSIRFNTGFPLELSNIGQRKFEFKKGINVIIGGNGTGKSVILKTLKGYCSINKGGWTVPNEPAEIGIGRLGGATDYPHVYSTFTPANCQANVIWDGTPTFFQDGDIRMSELTYFFRFKTEGDGITTEQDIEHLLKSKPSSGQYRLHKLNKILNMVKKGPPIYTKENFGHFKNKDDNYYSLREFEYWTYINKLYIDNFGVGQNTIILDEPERSLSLPKQKELFMNIIPNEFQNFQIIIATHSIYSLFTPNVNYIEMENGYIADFKAAIKDIASLAKLEELPNTVINN